MDIVYDYPFLIEVESSGSLYEDRACSHRGFIAFTDNRHYEATLRRLSSSRPGEFS
ncbi:hypothetical protein NKI38_27955 [Mesorhizobium sp. M0621]|uniref:hypothetical protein n=1 Tax=Mesorhizobium sp. M0621 TaxID=2956974 RepID=UPI00333BAF21